MAPLLLNLLLWKLLNYEDQWKAEKTFFDLKRDYYAPFFVFLSSQKENLEIFFFVLFLS